jgi:hypothetical protein
MRDDPRPAPVPSLAMRGWWSTRSRAKIWDVRATPAEPARPAETQPAAEPAADFVPPQPPAEITPPAPVATPEPEPVAVAPEPPAPAAALGPEVATSPRPSILFETRPTDYLSRESLGTEPPASPLEVTITESPYYERTSLASPDFDPEAPADAATSSPSPSPSSSSAPASTNPGAANVDSQGEFLRLLEVVTSMCDHVIEYIEADRAERRQMMEMLTQLGRVITEGSAAAVAAFTALSSAHANAQLDAPESVVRAVAAPVAEPVVHTPIPTDTEPRERVIGGSMPAGPEPHVDVDLVSAESNPDDPALATLASAKIHIAVEVRGQFGDRWVDGFEICEVMSTPSGPRYRLRRQRDGVVLPELFDATNIRHVETAEPEEPQTSRERSMGSHPSGSNGESAPVNGSGYWSRS